MAAEPHPLPTRPRRPELAWAPLTVALTATVALAALIAGGAAAPGAAILAIMLVLALGGGLALWLRRQEQAAAAAAPGRAGAGDQALPNAPYAEVLERLDDPLLVVAGDDLEDFAGRRVIWANAAARELLRPTRAAAPLVTMVRDPKVLEAVDEALFGKIASDTTYETGGAQDRVWRASARPLPDTGGRALAVLMLRDETELRRSERTRADFLANASHELRTPLASLSGFIETLRGHARDDPGARDRFLAIMHDQARRMGRLIEDLMSLSRIELNEHIPPHGRVDLNLAVRDVLEALTPLAEEKGVRFEARLPAESVAIEPADRDQVAQVVQNLAENALKYAPKGSPVVLELTAGVTAEAALAQRNPVAAHLSLLTPDHAGDRRYALLRICDAGSGMAREHLPRLTERFYRVEGQRTAERSGTGLGLAIVKHIVNRHRGGLTVESAPGQGSSFAAYFPMPLLTRPDADDR